MNRLFVFIGILLAGLCLTSCRNGGDDLKDTDYTCISAKQAKEIMDTEQDYTILDVRTQPEYDARHIPGAVLIPVDEVEEKAETVLKDKEQVILVYCRSGVRSKMASKMLAKMGYEKVKEFGGILDWAYEVE